MPRSPIKALDTKGWSELLSSQEGNSIQDSPGKEEARRGLVLHPLSPLAGSDLNPFCKKLIIRIVCSEFYDFSTLLNLRESLEVP